MLQQCGVCRDIVLVCEIKRKHTYLSASCFGCKRFKAVLAAGDYPYIVKLRIVCDYGSEKFASESGGGSGYNCGVHCFQTPLSYYNYLLCIVSHFLHFVKVML